MQKITTFLWFDGRAEEAVEFYTSIFKDSKTGEILCCGDAGPGPKGSVLTVEFELNGQGFVALNGGPMFHFTPAISFAVNCETQAEVDYYWDKLSAGGKKDQCGWVADKFGVSWQIVPTILIRMLKDQDPSKAARVMKAMLQMAKLDIQTLQQSYDQTGGLSESSD